MTTQKSIKIIAKHKDKPNNMILIKRIAQKHLTLIGQNLCLSQWSNYK